MVVPECQKMAVQRELQVYALLWLHFILRVVALQPRMWLLDPFHLTSFGSGQMHAGKGKFRGSN